mmetsp:Transcript_48516/g.48881  ORF Transcript_48516/g.48881 Transcript_48516/m.48881 type:complete len:81 (+) Transcript_48516:114-356(+)
MPTHPFIFMRRVEKKEKTYQSCMEKERLMLVYARMYNHLSVVYHIGGGSWFEKFTKFVPCHHYTKSYFIFLFILRIDLTR